MTPVSLQAAAEEGVLGKPMGDADSWNGACSVCNDSVDDEHTCTDVACCSMCNYVCHKNCLGASDANLGMMNDPDESALCPECWQLTAAWKADPGGLSYADERAR